MTQGAREHGGVALRLVCPRCRRALRSEPDAWVCAACDLRFPVLHGIPDLRLRPDPYLSIEAERDKARRLYEFGRDVSFDRLLARYYEITDDVPPELAIRYTAYVKNGPVQASATLDALAPDSGADTLLDLGCGAGGLIVAAAGRFRRVVGVDIALRWLVICKKRLDEQGIDAVLVCADAESLPFEDAAFTHVAAGDLIEHVMDVRSTLEEVRRVLLPGGTAWLCAANRLFPGPHPSTRVIGIGYLPRRLRSALLMRLRGVDSLRFVRLLSPFGIRRLARAVGFLPVSLAPRRIASSPDAVYPFADRVLIAVYRGMLRSSLLRLPLALFGPSFEMVLRKPEPAHPAREA